MSSSLPCSLLISIAIFALVSNISAQSCARFKDYPLNACFLYDRTSAVYGKMVVCDAATQTYTMNTYVSHTCDGEPINNTAQQLSCIEGVNCFCASDIECEFAHYKDYLQQDHNIHCSGITYENRPIVLNECVPNQIENGKDQFYTCATDLTAYDCLNGTVDETSKTTKDVCDLQCAQGCNRVNKINPVGTCIVSVHNNAVSSQKYVCDDGGETYTVAHYDDDICGHPVSNQSEVCADDCQCSSDIDCAYSKFNIYMLSCNETDTDYIGAGFVTDVCIDFPDYGYSKAVCDAQLTMQSCLKDAQVAFPFKTCDTIECFGSRNATAPPTVTPTAQPTESPTKIETRCARLGDVPLNVCLKLSVGGKDHSFDYSCSVAGTEVVYTMYDDTECDGNVLNKTQRTINCTGVTVEFDGQNLPLVSDGCVCRSDIQCEYAKHTQYTASPIAVPVNTTDIDYSCMGQDYIEIAKVINECLVIYNRTSYQYVCDETDGLRAQSCDDDVEIIPAKDTCELQCVVKTTQTPTIAPTTQVPTALPTPAPTQRFCAVGADTFGQFTVGFGINCVNETVTIEISYAGFNNNWFGILFAEDSEESAMIGEALIFTIGKIDEAIPNSDIDGNPKLYFYNITEQGLGGPKYNGGENNEMDWKQLSFAVTGGIARIVARQSLDKTQFNVSTESVPIRWAFGANEGYNLVEHTTDGRAEETGTLALQRVGTTAMPTTTTAADRDDNSGIIIGAIIGAFFLVMICFGIIWIIMDRKKKNESQQKQTGKYTHVGADTNNDCEMQGTS